jgi:biofilm PGA synthesis N-glycosyltransferase PgaC
MAVVSNFHEASDPMSSVLPVNRSALDADRVGSTASRPTPSVREAATQELYLPVLSKYVVALAIAIAWTALSVWLSQPWLRDLADVVGWTLAVFVITFIAYVPGFMNSFLISTILLDRRPRRRTIEHYPDLSILVACYNEADNIAKTIASLALQKYPGRMDILILDDGSTDGTAGAARVAIRALAPTRGHAFRVVEGGRNVGKAGVLNRGLAMARADIVLTIDGDCWIYEDAVQRLVERYANDPANTRAVAGAVLVSNSRENWLTKAQEWDYFHGIAAVKRMQSMYHGTLVAQGAFSLYDRAALNEVGGFPACVGEDIVVTWALLDKGYRVGYCEDAIAFTNVPETLNVFAQQRKRWSRGLMEAFKLHGRILFKPRLTTLFIWWNLLFLPLDLVYTLAFIPGLVLALFGYYYLAGILTLLVLPLAALWNYCIYRVQEKMFKRQDLQVRDNAGGFLFYVLGYSLLMQPVCVWGYVSELLGASKRWGTK